MCDLLNVNICDLLGDVIVTSLCIHLLCRSIRYWEILCIKALREYDEFVIYTCPIIYFKMKVEVAKGGGDLKQLEWIFN